MTVAIDAFEPLEHICSGHASSLQEANRLNYIST